MDVTQAFWAVHRFYEGNCTKYIWQTIVLIIVQMSSKHVENHYVLREYFSSVPVRGKKQTIAGHTLYIYTFLFNFL